MKFIFTLFCIGFCVNATMAQRCGTSDYIVNHPLKKNNTLRAESPGAAKRDTLANEVITIPIVIHILYNSNDQNISDEQAISQITALNSDYRRRNADTINTPDVFKGVAADTRIQFCLAKVDPMGRPTSGIIHKATTQSQFLTDDQMKFSAKGGDDAWDATKYLNIWVCNLFGRTLGYAVLPGSPLNIDGVVIRYDCFGTTSNLRPPYNKGRTATHEIGHWLGLKHLWGDTMCGDDSIADTPTQETSNSFCPVFPHLSSCSINPSGDMFMNYMDFTDDGCMNMFTKGQKAKMRSLFALGNVRNSFLNSSACDSSNAEAGPLPADPVSPGTTSIKINVYPNPFINTIRIESDAKNDLSGKVLRLYDITGKLFKAQTIQSQNTILDVHNLPSGMYVLKIEDSEGSLIYKLIKQP